MGFGVLIGYSGWWLRSSRRSGHDALVAAEDYKELFGRLAGRSLIQFCVGSGVRLDLEGSPHYEITIESLLTIVAGNIEQAEPTSVEVLGAFAGSPHEAGALGVRV